MARPIVLSNGELHVGINNYGLVHDFYFPYVGLENHSAGQSLRHKVGVWIDGSISWLDDGSWEISFRSSDQALIGHTKAKHTGLQVVVEFDDFVDATNNVFMRNIHVINLAPVQREIRLFMHQAFVIGDSRSNTDTAQFLPSSNTILHYRGRRAFVVSAQDQYGTPFDQHSIGLFGIEGREGTYRDADDGELQNGDVEHGRVDSTLRFVLSIKGHESSRVHYWISAATSTDSALLLHRKITEQGLDRQLHDTVAWWQHWLDPAVSFADRLPEKYRSRFLKSAMVIKSHIDKRGAVIASTDTAMLNYSRDAYGYCWPRDGSYALWPLIRMGYKDEPISFFAFCQRVLDRHGYLMHKYRADGALGSSWHPYRHGDLSAPPIQEDETALVVFMFAQFYQLHQERDLLERFYEPLIVPMANFMTSYIDPVTHLPKPSYDLWEERFLTSTYTTAVTYAALSAAASLAEVHGDSRHAVRWQSAAEDMYESAAKYLLHPDGFARRGIVHHKDTVDYDDTVDASSFYGAFMFGLFGTDTDNILKATREAMSSENGLAVPRYANDSYRRVSEDSPSNYWLLCSLWIAQYHIEHNKMEQALPIIDWVCERASSTGMLSEQVNPYTDAPLSVSPLVWSHAELIESLLDMLSGKK